MKHFVDVADHSREELERALDLAEGVKWEPDRFRNRLSGLTLLMLFLKPSTRTRLSFETGMTQLGGHAIHFSKESSQLSRGEPIRDTAAVVSRYDDGVMARVHGHDEILELKRHSDVPVINGLTDLLHPCQALSDVFTLRETGLELGEARLVYLGDGNNVANSLLQAGAALGLDVTACTPEEHRPDPDIVARARERAETTGAEVRLATDPGEAVEGADALYTDVWVSMGQEDEGKRLETFEPYRLDAELVRLAGDPVVMHPMPAHRGQEIAADVMNSPHSIIYDQAENRLHVQKALLLELLG